MDFKGRWTGPDGRPAPTFAKHLYTFSAIDSISGFAYARLCRNRVTVVAHLEELRLFVQASARQLKILRCDNEFSTAAVKTWALQHKIQLLPSVPHEHDRVRKVDRLHRTAQEMVVKFLSNKPHLSPAYWGFCYLHCIDLINIASADKPSPYFAWH